LDAVANAGGLEQSSSAKSQRRKLLITDGVFSMEGYTAPLPQFLEATTGSDTMLAIDESHAAGGRRKDRERERGTA
jgi:7-keto-8-aminopelargonate synthetase-like enzyme